MDPNHMSNQESKERLGSCGILQEGKDLDFKCSAQSQRGKRLHTWPENKVHQAKPFTFKKKVPAPGCYPLNFSPYRLSYLSSSCNAVRLTPAEVYSDCKLIHQITSQEFSSHYFEEGVPESDKSGSKSAPKRSEASTVLPKQFSMVRSSGRRALTSLQLPIPKTIHEERKQLRAALRASVESNSCAQINSDACHEYLPDLGIEASSKSFHAS